MDTTLNTEPTFLAGSNLAEDYRLCKKPDGTLVLQGSFKREEWKSAGVNYIIDRVYYDWQDIPTVDLTKE